MTRKTKEVLLLGGAIVGIYGLLFFLGKAKAQQAGE